MYMHISFLVIISIIMCSCNGGGGSAGGASSGVGGSTGKVSDSIRSSSVNQINYTAPHYSFADVSNKFLYITDNNRVVKYDLTANAYIGWVGRVLASPTGGATGCTYASVGSLTPGWCTGGTDQTGTGSGVMNFAAGIWGDGTFLYVVDQGNSRVLKYNASTGSFVGWLGRIASTGGTCTAGVNLFSGGWCVGGTSESGSYDGMLLGPSGIWGNATYIYVSDTMNGRVSRYNKTSGAFSGWVGQIKTTNPAAPGTALGGAGCGAATIGSFTPNWCTGGTSDVANPLTEAAFNQNQGISGDSTYIYIADSLNFRVARYNISNGAYQGWIGRNHPNAFSVGGGVGGSISGTGDGMFFTPQGIVAVGSSVYTADLSNMRVSKNTNDGAFVGWIGKVGASPTGGIVAGCAGAAVGTVTPGWCTGGTATQGTGNGMFYSPYGPSSDAINLYVPDNHNNVVIKFDLATGAFSSFIN